MTNNIYCLYNTLSKRYGEVIAFPTHQFAIQRIKDKLGNSQEYELVHIGTISIETGIVTKIDPVRITDQEEL